MSLISILKNIQRGFLKEVLLGAGLTLGTSAISMTMLKTAITYMQKNTGSISADVAGLASLSGIDVAMSIVLGAIVSRHAIQSSKLTLMKK